VGKFIGSKEDIEAARKRGVRIGKVERVPGDGLDKLFIVGNNDDAGFIPRHQSIPAEVIVVNASGTYVCHEIDAHGMKRGTRFGAAYNLGGGTPSVGDKVLISVDTHGLPVFFFEDSGGDFDIIVADGYCMADSASPTSTFNGTWQVYGTDGSAAGFVSTKEVFVEFTTPVDTTTIISGTSYLRMMMSFGSTFLASYFGATANSIQVGANVNIGLVTTSFSCGSLTWNNKPSSTLINIDSVMAVSANSTSTAGMSSVTSAISTHAENGHGSNVGAVSTNLFYGVRFYMTRNVATSVGTWTSTYNWLKTSSGSVSLISLPGGGQFG